MTFHNVLWISTWIVSALLIIYALFIVSGALEGWLDFKEKNKQKRPMYWCHKHGAVPVDYCLPFMGDQKICPLCFNASMDAVRNAK